VAVFGPIKRSWRSVLAQWKKRNKGCVPKQLFPSLLNQCPTKIEANNCNNMKSRFRATGIMPLDRNQVLKRLPQAKQEPALQDINHALTNTMNDMLEDIRQAQKPKTTRKKKLQVEPSKSVSSVDLILDENEQSPSTSKTHTKTKKRKRVEEQTKTDEDDNENSYESETEQDQDNLFEEVDHENTKPAESFSSNHTQVKSSSKNSQF
jgi:hypothetical protein